MPKKEKGPVRIGDESSGWVHKAPDVGEGAAGIIVKKLGCSSASDRRRGRRVRMRPSLE